MSTKPLICSLQHSLYQQINFDAITTLNESVPNAGKAIVKKTWAERISDSSELCSDTDEQLLMYIPYVELPTHLTRHLLTRYHSFASQIKLHSILIRTSLSDSAPKTLKVFINRSDLDFSTASELPPTQEFHLSQTSEVQDIPVKRALFGKVQSLTLFFEDNHGQGEEDVTSMNYLGFKGEWTSLGKAPTSILYEAAANPADHKIKGTAGMSMENQLGQ